MPGHVPKVARLVAGQPMVRWVVDAVRETGANPIVLVIGHGAKAVRDVFRGDDRDLVWVIQEQQLGTGHATACAREALAGFEGDVLVLAADGPLIRPEVLGRLVERQRRTAAAATLAAATVEDPAGYGRILRDEAGRFKAIVEHASASDAERRIREIYPSYACFDAELLFGTLETLPPDEASGEHRVTDVPGVLRRRGLPVELVDDFPPADVLSINTPEQLEQVGAILSSRLEVKR